MFRIFRYREWVLDKIKRKTLEIINEMLPNNKHKPIDNITP